MGLCIAQAADTARRLATGSIETCRTDAQAALTFVRRFSEEIVEWHRKQLLIGPVASVSRRSTSIHSVLCLFVCVCGILKIFRTAVWCWLNCSAVSGREELEAGDVTRQLSSTNLTRGRLRNGLEVFFLRIDHGSGACWNNFDAIFRGRSVANCEVDALLAARRNVVRQAWAKLNFQPTFCAVEHPFSPSLWKPLALATFFFAIPDLFARLRLRDGIADMLSSGSASRSFF